MPWREIFVYSRRVEGIHLRAGPVARGGLRWSDRRDDFRTEVLGLMKAQRVKNAVIVPTGAKGGFYPKRLPDPARDRDAWVAEGTESYQLFIRSLLSLTDNIVGGKVVHPDGVVIHDGEDPYFVVAADKGTASFSDTANAIAEERGFWLGDAFASGGSNGYDHKAMGITARGAWLSVQRHFLEMGVDVQTEPVRVAGCGDMSGDVFGNGMLLSKAIKLVAAFDHRHIFLDPDPDPAASWEERKRLFELPRSSWADYDAKLISKGGGVFPRTSKRIPLSPEARAALGHRGRGARSRRADHRDPQGAGRPAVVRRHRHLRQGQRTRAHAAGRRSGQRRAARRRRAKCAPRSIGEGANLGVTQAGRIEFALARRADQHRLHRQFGRRRLLGQRGQHQDRARRRAARRAADRASAHRAARDDDRRGRRSWCSRTTACRRWRCRSPRRAAPRRSPSHAAPDRDARGPRRARPAHRRAGRRRDASPAAPPTAPGLTRPELAVLLSSAKLVLQDAIEASALPRRSAA